MAEKVAWEAQPRYTAMVIDVLDAMLQARNGDDPELSMFQIGHRAHRTAPFPALDWLEDAEWVTSRWLDGPYPRRRVYSLTPWGVTQAAVLVYCARQHPHPQPWHRRARLGLARRTATIRAWAATHSTFRRLLRWLYRAALIVALAYCLTRLA